MAEFLDPEHAREIEALQGEFAARTQWPTWMLIVAIYGGWFVVLSMLRNGTVPPVAAMPLLALVGTWHLSLQHELLHGHPTRSARLNMLLGWPPLSVWYPYTVYRESHLAHHRDESLTIPGIDPETNYVHADAWTQLPRWRRALCLARKTLLGRIVVGPPTSVAAMLANEAKALARGDMRHVPAWLAHGVGVVVLLGWVQSYAGIPWWHYLLGVAWPALGLAMVRSLYEHRAAPHPKARIAINEAGFVMRLLFLNNNLHLVHHDLPALPWFQLPRAYRMRREAYRQKCGGFVVPGYGALLRRYAWRATDAVQYPSSNTVV